MLVEALGLEVARLIPLCGAGGKTSLMLALAREFAAAGDRVLVTTTTKIASDEAAGPWPVITAAGADEIVARARCAPWGNRARNRVAIAISGHDDGGEKLVGFPPECIDAVARQPDFDRILVEADGSRRMPLKAPGAHEPVIPSTTDALIIVAGLSGLGQPLDETTVFRANLWAARTGVALGAPVSAESLARMVVDPGGLARGAPHDARRILFLNQADTAQRIAAAKQVIQALTGRGWKARSGRHGLPASHATNCRNIGVIALCLPGTRPSTRLSPSPRWCTNAPSLPRLGRRGIAARALSRLDFRPAPVLEELRQPR